MIINKINVLSIPRKTKTISRNYHLDIFMIQKNFKQYYLKEKNTEYYKQRFLKFALICKSSPEAR